MLQLLIFCGSFVKSNPDLKLTVLDDSDERSWPETSEALEM